MCAPISIWTVSGVEISFAFIKHPLISNYTNMVLGVVLVVVWILIASIPFWVGLVCAKSISNAKLFWSVLFVSLFGGYLYFKTLPTRPKTEKPHPTELVDDTPTSTIDKAAAERESLASNDEPRKDSEQTTVLKPVTSWVKDANFHKVIHYQPYLIYWSDRMFVKCTIGRYPKTPGGWIMWICSIPAYIVRLIIYYLAGSIVSALFIYLPPPWVFGVGLGLGSCGNRKW